MPAKNLPKKTEIDAGQSLQAVVLADSFNERFAPITVDIPRCLLPLCNVPMIEYTMEFLALSGVQEVFVFCTAHTERIREYFDKSKWTSPRSPLILRIVQASECHSIGDAMRELDARQLITTDFILVNGDLVSNAKLSKVLEAHRARKTTDKNAIMTMVVREASPKHPSRAQGESALFVLDSLTNKCVHYESLEAFPRKKRAEMPLTVLEDHAEVQFRNDLIDAGIDICSVEVPALFTENFDYQDIRKDFVHGILTSDLLGKTIYAHIVEDAYAARVRTGQMYDAVSKDILARWIFPMVPDSNLQEDEYEYGRNQIYKGRRVVLAQSCVLGSKLQIGGGTVVGENTLITNSVIGRRCKIGANVVIDGAYLWDDVIIRDGSRVEKSILADKVILDTGVIIERGCLISFGVRLGPNITLPKFSKLSLHKQKFDDTFAGDSDDEASEKKEEESFEVGMNGNGYIWVDRDDDDNDEGLDPRNIKIASLAYEFKDITADDEDEESASEIGSVYEDSDTSDTEPENVETASEAFKAEVQSTIERAFTENHTVDIAALEINTLRMASNGSYEDVRQVLIPALLSRVDLTKPAGSLKQVFGRWGPLIARVVHSDADQVHVLYVLQIHCAEFEPHTKLFSLALRLLYELDIIEEDNVFKWYNSERHAQLGDAAIKLKEKAKPFVQWLKEAEEEESDSEDD